MKKETQKAHDFVGPNKVNKYVHCRNCGLIFEILKGRGPCPGGTAS